MIWYQSRVLISLATKVTAGQVEIVTAAYHQVYDNVTCGLTAKKPGASYPTLVIEYGTIFTFYNQLHVIR